jgi:hypothetical protein
VFRTLARGPDNRSPFKAVLATRQLREPFRRSQQLIRVVAMQSRYSHPSGNVGIGTLWGSNIGFCACCVLEAGRSQRV